MRFFITLDLPEKNKEQIKSVQNKLKNLLPQVRLTDYKKLHFTIAFIGEHGEQIKPDLIEILNLASEGIPPFRVTPSFFDGFPKLHEPHTLFLGVKGDVDKLFILQERIKDGLIKLHLEVDNRRYVPHIAVAKAIGLKINSQVEKMLEELVINDNLDPITVESIKLYESIPLEGTHTHKLLAEIQLL